MKKPNVGMAAVTVISALGFGACVSASFLPTANVPKRQTTQVNYYLDRMPAEPFDPVGIIQVTSPAGTDLNRVVTTAWKKAQQVGCDLIIDRTIYQPPPHRQAPPRASLAPRNASTCQYGAYQAPTYVAASPPPGQREFICGIWLAKPRQ